MELSKKLAVSFVIYLFLITACTGKQLETKVENKQSHTQYRAALAKFEEAREILKKDSNDNRKNDNHKAIKLFRSGIDALGTLYQHPELVDDTEMKLILAENNLDNKNFTEASALFEGILESRLIAYKKYFKLE